MPRPRPILALPTMSDIPSPTLTTTLWLTTTRLSSIPLLPAVPTMRVLWSPALMEFSPLSPTTELFPLSLLLLLLRPRLRTRPSCQQKRERLPLRLMLMLRLIPRPTRGTRTMLLTPTPTLPTPTAMCTPTTVCLITIDTMARERLPLSLPLIPRLIPRLTPGCLTMVLATPVTPTDMAITLIPDSSPTPTVTTELVAETDTELLCLALANNLNVCFSTIKLKL